MELKLALRNIRRSLRDYTIYFVTLIIGVAMFYAFNSISSQQILFDLQSAADYNIFAFTEYLIGLFSIVIAFVLGFLILYANRFLIRRRKREFGTYLILGMNPGAVSRVVVMETAFVGIASLGVGLALGVVLSQLFSFITAALFGMSMSHYQFVFSPSALVSTLISYAVIYLVVLLFNTITINRFTLLDLIYASTKNEKTPVRNLGVCFLSFVVAVALIIWAYRELIANGMVELNDQFTLSTVLMLVGTLLLFWSLAGFVIGVIQRVRSVYLKGLRPFTLRQIASKINTTFMALWAVCILLFFSITVFSVGIGFVQFFTGDIDEANPYDLSIKASISGSANLYTYNHLDEISEALRREFPERYAEAEAHHWNMESLISEQIPTWHEMVKESAEFNLWIYPNISYADLAEQAHLDEKQSSLFDLRLATGIEVASLSDVNRNLQLSGKEPVTLEAGTCRLLNNGGITQSFAQDLVNAHANLDIMGQRLSLEGPILSLQYEDGAMLSTYMIIMVPDEIIDAMANAGGVPYRSVINVDLNDPTPAGEQAFEDTLSKRFEEHGGNQWPIDDIISGSYMRVQAGGLRMLITYLAIYVGFVFLFSTAALLAIQLLSETSDSLPRYQMLSRLGCDRKQLGRSLLVQVLIYFCAPLAVAVCHSACAIGVLSDNLFYSFGITAGEHIALAALMVIIIYGGYLLITYFTSRSIVNNAVGK